MKNNIVKRHPSGEIASCLRLKDKNGKSYQYNRKQRRSGKVYFGREKYQYYEI